MRYKYNQKENTFKRILDAAERCFKKEGYNGIGIDGLAKEAGVTSGAFYGHFKSKISVFAHAIVEGLNEVSEAIQDLQKKYGDDWWFHFATFYMNERRLNDLSDSCALQSLTPEISRSTDEIKAIYEQELLKIVEVAYQGSKKSKNEIWCNLAMLTGGVNMCRAVKNKNKADEIALAIVNKFKH